MESLASRASQTVRLTAGKMSDVLSVQSDWFAILSMTAQGAEISINGSQFSETFPGDNGGAVENLRFRNPTAGTIEIRFISGSGLRPFIPSTSLPSSSVMETALRAVGWDGTEIPLSDSVDFAPALGAGYIRQKEILVSNLDPNSIVYVDDSDGNTILPVLPSTTLSVPTSDKVTLRNDTAEAIAVAVAQVYYVSEALLTTEEV